MTVQLPSSAVQGDGSLSVQEAAAILGCSEKTVRRRIKAHQLLAHRLPTSQGYEWRVHLDGSADHLGAPLAAQVDSTTVHLSGANGHVDGTDTVHLNTQSNQAPAQEGKRDTKSAAQVDTESVRPSDQALLKALELTDRLQRENMELAGRVGFLQAKLQATEEQLLALSAGAKQEEACPLPAQPSRPWWKIWE